MILDTAACKAMMNHVAFGIQGNIDMLNEADGMGDSDHGTGMGNGFTAVQNKLATNEFPDLGSLFKSIGLAIMMSSGGASGALFGTFFKDGAKALENVEQLDSQGFAHFLRMGLASVMKRGNAVKGDKTMVDALIPAVECATVNCNQPLETVFLLCAQEAENGSEETKSMIAKLGRMKHLGTRTIGYRDPGSITMALILRYMYEFLVSLQP